MKTGKSLVELATEIERRANAKRDYIVDTSAAAMIVREDKPRLTFGDQDLSINRIAHEQIADHTKIPRSYYDRMMSEAPELLATNVGEWFRRHPAPRMVRTLDGTTRSLLSDRYRPLENEDLAEAALPSLLGHDLKIMSCEITDRRLYIKAVSEQLFRDVPTGKKYGQGHTIYDTCAPAIIISNSEVGCGALSIEYGCYTKACTNMMLWPEKTFRKLHIGTKHSIGDEVYSVLTDEAREATDKAIWMQVRDVVAASLDEKKFEASLQQLGEAAEQKITADPVKVVERFAKTARLTEDERGGVLRHLIEGGDLTKYGLHAAVTRTAEDLGDYDRATEFERLGGKVIELSKTEWSSLAVAA